MPRGYNSLRPDGNAAWQRPSANSTHGGSALPNPPGWHTDRPTPDFPATGSCRRAHSPRRPVRCRLRYRRRCGTSVPGPPCSGPRKVASGWYPTNSRLADYQPPGDCPTRGKSRSRLCARYLHPRRALSRGVRFPAGRIPPKSEPDGRSDNSAFADTLPTVLGIPPSPAGRRRRRAKK